MAKKENRFSVTRTGGGFIEPETSIIVDRQTGINYLWVKDGYSGGLTPLLNRDGVPVVTPVSREYND